jgi:hypothetical protein
LLIIICIASEQQVSDAIKNAAPAAAARCMRWTEVSSAAACVDLLLGF